MQSLENILLWNLMAAVILVSQARPKANIYSPKKSGLRSDCVGNLMRLSMDKALAVGNWLEVEAGNGTQHIMLTPTLAAKCGYSMESDPWGNTRIYTSLMGCYVDNKDDTTFNVDLRLRVYSPASPEPVSHDVSQACSYSRWASREILCDRNYMEVSHAMAASDGHTERKGKGLDVQEASATPGIWKLTFYTPGPAVPMMLQEAEQNGYSARTTSNRLVVRSPYSAAETYPYPDGVAGIPMQVFRLSVYYNSPNGLRVVDMAAACPTGGVLFTDNVISWYVPRSVTPLIDGSVKIIEMHMGINGQRLDKSQMAAKGYTLSLTEFHIIVEIPMGSPDVYYKSHALDYQYRITYTVEPMLEVLWRAVNTQEDTRYKILFPITTPPMPGLNQVSNNTIPEDRVFTFHLLNFLYDVELVNITFSTGVFTVEDCKAKGFTVQEQSFPNGTKTFSLQVPFDADVVLKHNPGPLVTDYFLSLIFGFVVMPEYTPFHYPVTLQASLQDVVLPTVTGVCDSDQFYITVTYGNQNNLETSMTLVGMRLLTPETSAAYKLQKNDKYFSFIVPYNSEDTAVEFFTSDSIRARLDVILWDSTNDWLLAELFLACTFPLMTTQCYSNGTMTARAVKVESTPSLVLSWLTLRDTSCKPVSSDNRFANFIFRGDSCGTTRTFFDNYVLYENEIALYHNMGVGQTSPPDPEYKQTVSCYYQADETQTFGFGYKQGNEPAAEMGTGQLMVQMRLAKDLSYEVFYQAEDYPVAKYLKEPLYFEVELMHSADQHLELILTNCWATSDADRMSLPSWDIIIDSCENHEDRYVTIFHPVMSDARVSFPSHVKRFSIKMFAFTDEEVVLKDEIYIHCDALICDTSSKADNACSTRCARPVAMRKGKKQPRSSDSTHQKQISSGPFLLNS